MDTLVQFGEGFNSRTKKSVRSGVWLSQTRPIPRSPDGDNKTTWDQEMQYGENKLIQPNPAV